LSAPVTPTTEYPAAVAEGRVTDWLIADPTPEERTVIADTVRVPLDVSSPDSYAKFLRIKALPRYRFVGRTAEFPAEYAGLVGLDAADVLVGDYTPLPGLFDYQRAIASLAIQKRKFAVFADCGLGKTLILSEFAKHAAEHLPRGRAVLIVSPLMVVSQTLAEIKAFYGDTLPVEQVAAADLPAWLTKGTARVGITNYDALNDTVPQGRLGALILDESSMLKSAYGKWGQACIRLGRGLGWKLAATGTPAPNDRIEYANHAVFLDAFPTVNSFLARFFVNRGQTDNRWELKPHALGPFYRALSHWSIFLTNPATYGWKDNTESVPPIHVHIHEVPLTTQQRGLVLDHTGELFAGQAGGITSRSVLSQIAKGNHRGEDVDTRKPAFIRQLVDGWPDESTIIWCLYNREQDVLAETFPEAANVTGETPVEQRLTLIDDFKSGRRRILISKPKILGFGLNLQVATRQVFSGLQDSYEQFYQAVKRSNRYGSTRPLNVHIPVTEIERPMIETVLSKSRRVQHDTEQQERMFKDALPGQ
jgi:superfamily II DNA or RNA helicase